MSTTLTNGATTLTLPIDLLWVDEYAWAEVEQRHKYGITGSVIIDSAAKAAGRTIHLEADENHAWMSKSTLDTLRSWAAVAGLQLTLSLRGIDHTVVFDHAAGAIDAAPVWGVSDPVDPDFYVVSLRFLKV